MAKVTYENLKQALLMNNDWMKQYVYDVITNFSPTSVNVARILSHLTNTTIHVTPEDKELWDSSYIRAKTYTDGKFAEMSSLELKVVDTLPAENILKNAIYLLKTDVADVYNQYVYSDAKWVSLGSTSVNMSDYYTREQVDSIVSELKSAAQHSHSNQEILNLITAAFTVEEKQLLAKLGLLDTDGLTSHMKNSGIHLTTDEKATLAKLLDLDIDATKSHISNTTVHLTAEEKEEYNNILSKANKYTDKAIEHLIVCETVDTLPVQGKTDILYLVPASNPSPNHVYDKYLWINGAWESVGGGSSDSSLDDIGFDQFVSRTVMENYVSQNTHEHNNKSVLDQTEVAFTEELFNIIIQNQSVATAASVHIENSSVHLSDEQIELIDSMKTVKSDISNTINETITKMNESGSLGLKAIYADSLPTNLSAVDKQAIYFIRISEPSGDGLEDNADISSVEQAINYRKFMWSSEFNCWEDLDNTDSTITDEEIQEILSDVQ